MPVSDSQIYVALVFALVAGLMAVRLSIELYK
ncbi:MAG: photosystem I reaction center subunit XII [Cyanobacteria bacterium J06621_8]